MFHYRKVDVFVFLVGTCLFLLNLFGILNTAMAIFSHVIAIFKVWCAGASYKLLRTFWEYVNSELFYNRGIGRWLSKYSLQYLCESWAWWFLFHLIFVLGRQTGGWIPGVLWLASFCELLSSRFSGRPCLK